jgi:hypothetical protein
MDALDDLLAKDANTLTTLEWAVILHVNKEKAELAAAELARLQAIEAAALEVKRAYEPFSDMDHYTAVAKLESALAASPQPPQPGDGDGAG